MAGPPIKRLRACFALLKSLGALEIPGTAKNDLPEAEATSDVRRLPRLAMDH